jgi:hypothetical protein
MKITIYPNLTIYVRWQHHRDGALVDPGTTCVIKQHEDEILGFGYAKKHPTDAFDKEKGRKLSLARALKNALLNKEEREIVWVEYFARMA